AAPAGCPRRSGFYNSPRLWIPAVGGQAPLVYGSRRAKSQLGRTSQSAEPSPACPTPRSRLAPSLPLRSLPSRSDRGLGPGVLQGVTGDRVDRATVSAVRGPAAGGPDARDRLGEGPGRE